jgi:hypothetical protein
MPKSSSLTSVARRRPALRSPQYPRILRAILRREIVTWFFPSQFLSHPANLETGETAKLEAAGTSPSPERPKMGFGFVSQYAMQRHPSAQTAPHGPIDQGASDPQSRCDASFPTIPQDASQNFNFCPQPIENRVSYLTHKKFLRSCKHASQSVQRRSSTPPGSNPEARQNQARATPSRASPSGPITKGYSRFTTKYGIACTPSPPRK